MTPNLISAGIGNPYLPPARDGYRAGIPSWHPRNSAYQPRSEDKVYLLLYPPAAVAAQMVTLGSRLGWQFGLPGRPTHSERLHVSLCFLCRFVRLTSGLLAKIDDALSILTMPPFLIGFDRLMNFGRKSGPLVLCGNDDSVAGVMMLQQEIVSALTPVGFCRGRRSFTPHVTLNYANCIVPEREIEHISWLVQEVALVRSLHGRSQHRVLRRWTLQPPGWLN
jgi:2'-5' RNA ligase